MILQEMKTDRNRVGGGHEIQRGLHLMLAKWITLWMKMYSFREMCLFLLQVTALKCLAGVLTFNNSYLLLITKAQWTCPSQFWAENIAQGSWTFCTSYTQILRSHFPEGRLLLSYQQHLLCQEHKPKFTIHPGEFSFCEREIQWLGNISF